MPDSRSTTFTATEAPLAKPAPAEHRLPLPVPTWVNSRPLLYAGLLAFAAIETLAGAWDADAARAAAAVSSSQLRVWQAVTVFGSSGYMFALSGGLVAAALLTGRFTDSVERRMRCGRLAWRSAYVFACVAVSGLEAQAIKHLTGRMRPSYPAGVGAFDWLGPSLRSGADSFPSGHATSAFAAAVALALLRPRLRLPLLGAATLVGVSRVMVGSHYPTDVLAGAALGTGTAWWLATVGARHGRVFRRADPVRPAPPHPHTAEMSP